MTHLKEVFKRDWNNKLEAANKEFQDYKNTDKLMFLQQAGSKLFSAVENYLMYKYNKRVRSYNDLQVVVRNNQDDLYLLSQAAQLHYFFYNADLQMTRYDAESIYKGVRQKFIGKLKILDIQNLPSGGFDDVVAGNIIITIENTKNNSGRIKIQNFQTKKILFIPLEKVTSNTNLTVNINLNPINSKVIGRIQANKIKELIF